MANLRILLNLLWIILGGLIMALGWAFAGVLMAITIIGLPWVPACFRIARFTLWPFGYQAVAREQQYHLADIGRLVAGIRTSDTGNRLFHQHHRHTLRLAARQNAAHLPRPHRYENRSHIRAKLGKQHNATALVRHRG